jgi:hypothetical protein
MARSRLVTVLLATCAVAGCRTRPAPGPAPGSAQPAAVAAPRYHPSGKVPVDPRRMTPPPGIAAHAIAVGARAPDVDLPLAGGGRFRLTDALAGKERALLVFYRGDW